MNKPKRFVDTILRNSDGETLNVLQEEYIIDHEEKLENEKDCACGQHLKVGWKAYYAFNVKTRKMVIIGSCCKNKLNPKGWNKKKDYLYNAHSLARDYRESEFVMGLINKLTEYGSSLIISKKQAAWLEGITGQKWKWKTWE
jgi:hypothetical protein